MNEMIYKQNVIVIRLSHRYLIQLNIFDFFGVIVIHQILNSSQITLKKNNGKCEVLNRFSKN
jgi:hypothetical protein